MIVKFNQAQNPSYKIIEKFIEAKSKTSRINSI